MNRAVDRCAPGHPRERMQAMSSDGSTESRQFTASREAFSTAWIKGTKVWQAVYTVIFVAFVGVGALMMFNTSRGAKTHFPRYTGLIIMAVLLGGSAVLGVYMFWRSRQK